MVHVELPVSKPTYTYSSVPRTPWDKSKCKDGTEGRPLPHGNIMFDKRVVRGPAFALHPIATGGVESQAVRDAEARRRAIARRKAQRVNILKMRVGTPPPVEGRKHDPVQTEAYLEEVLDHPIELSTETQTELMLDRPESPLYIPAKTGVDMSTQIQPGELFDFDTEVGPIIHVLVGKTLEQALVEVMEEEELEAIKTQQREFKEARNAEQAEEQRLQEHDTRMRLEMEHRMSEHEEEMKNQKEAQDRIAAAVLTTGFLGLIIPDIVRGLQDSGQVPDPIQQEIDEVFMTWMMKEIKDEVQRILDADKCILNIMKDIQKMREEAAKEEASDIEEQEEFGMEEDLNEEDFKQIETSDVADTDQDISVY